MTDIAGSPATFHPVPRVEFPERAHDIAILFGAGILLVAVCVAIAALPVGPNNLPRESTWLFVP
jgi:hypothetical protein